MRLSALLVSVTPVAQPYGDVLAAGRAGTQVEQEGDRAAGDGVGRVAAVEHGAGSVLLDDLAGCGSPRSECAGHRCSFLPVVC